MHEENKTAETVETVAETTESQQTETTETKPIDDATKRLEYLEREFKEVIKQRDEAKRKARELEEKTLAEQGKWKELYEQTKAEYDRLNDDLSVNLQYREKYTTLEKSIRESLISQLPEAKRKFAERFELDELKEFVSVETQNIKPGTADAARVGKGRADYSKVTLGELTDEEKDHLAKTNPVLYQQKLKEFFHQNQRF